MAVMQVETLRQELMQVCESKTVKDHLAGELRNAYKNGVKQFRAHQFDQTIGTPAATFRKEGLSLERLMEQWWPERLRWTIHSALPFFVTHKVPNKKMPV